MSVCMEFIGGTFTSGYGIKCMMKTQCGDNRMCTAFVYWLDNDTRQKWEAQAEKDWYPLCTKNVSTT